MVALVNFKIFSQSVWILQKISKMTKTHSSHLRREISSASSLTKHSSWWRYFNSFKTKFNYSRQNNIHFFTHNTRGTCDPRSYFKRSTILSILPVSKIGVILYAKIWENSQSHHAPERFAFLGMIQRPVVFPLYLRGTFARHSEGLFAEEEAEGHSSFANLKLCFVSSSTHACIG